METKPAGAGIKLTGWHWLGLGVVAIVVAFALYDDGKRAPARRSSRADDDDQDDDDQDNAPARTRGKRQQPAGLRRHQEEQRRKKAAKATEADDGEKAGTDGDET